MVIITSAAKARSDREEVILLRPIIMRTPPTYPRLKVKLVPKQKDGLKLGEYQFCSTGANYAGVGVCSQPIDERIQQSRACTCSKAALGVPATGINIADHRT